MSRCLSDEALMRLMAELGSGEEQSHLAGCAACAARRRRMSHELDRIRQVLLTTPEPRTASRRRRPIVAVAGLAAVAVAALVWVEIAVWKTIQPTDGSAGVEQVEAALEDVTAAIFSVDGEPTQSFVEGLAVTGRDPDGWSTGCDEPRWLDEAECSDALTRVEEPENEIDSTERTVFDVDSVDQGG